MTVKCKVYDTSTISDLILQRWIKLYPASKVAALKKKYESLDKELVKAKKQVAALKASKTLDKATTFSLEEALAYFKDLKVFYKSLYTTLSFLNEKYAKTPVEKRETLVEKVVKNFQKTVLDTVVDQDVLAATRKFFPKTFDAKEVKSIKSLCAAIYETLDLLQRAR